MIPVFIRVTDFMGGTKRMINMTFVKYIMPAAEGKGCVLMMTEERKLLIKETMEELERELNRQTAEIRYECWKKIAEGKELL